MDNIFSNRRTFKILMSTIKKYKFRLFLIIFCMLMYALLNPMLIYVLKPIVDKLFVSSEVAKFNLGYADYIKHIADIIHIPGKYSDYIHSSYTFSKKNLLYLLTLYLITIAFFKGFFRFLHTYNLAYIVSKIIRNIRQKLFNKYIDLSMEYHTKKNTGDSLSRFTNDVNILQGYLSSLILDAILRPAEILGLIIFVVALNWRLSLLAFSILPLVGLIILLINKLIRKILLKVQIRMGELTSVFEESLSGIKVIKAFVAENKAKNKFKKENELLFNDFLKSMFFKLLSSPLIEFITIFGVIFVLWSAYYFEKGNLSSGTLVAFIAGLMTMYKPIKSLTQLNVTWQHVRVSITRIYSILEIDCTIKEVKKPLELKKAKKNVVFNNVSFSYDENEEDVIKNISLNVQAGKRIALVGASGVGKTTLLNLLPRFFDIRKGILSIDNVNVKNYSLETLRKNIALVEQEVFLFNMSIAANIAFPNDELDIDKIIDCAKKANAHDFIQNLPKGYETLAGERGAKLSVGQKQRIAIARAIYKDAPILILDEATSALDSDSESIVQAALDTLMQDRTTFVIAHRLSTILKADNIIVLQKGKIVEQGTHDFLIKKKKVYYEFYKKQFPDKV